MAYSVTDVVIYIHDDHEWDGLEYSEELREAIIEEVEGLVHVESCEFFDSIDSMAVTIDMGGDWYQERVNRVVEKIQAILDDKREI